MKTTVSLIKFGLTAFLLAASANAATLYHISTFDNGSSTSNLHFDPARITITTPSGVTGSSAIDLRDDQTYRIDLETSTYTGNQAPRITNTADNSRTAGYLLLQKNNTDQFFHFGISAIGSNTLDLTSLTFDALRGTTNATTRGYNVDYALNGSTTFFNLAAANVTANRSSADPDNVNISLIGAEFQGITSIEFRVQDTGNTVEFNNFVINGSVIPEPSTALLGGLGLLALLRRRR